LELEIFANPTIGAAGGTSWSNTLSDVNTAISWTKFFSKNVCFRSYHILNLVKNMTATLGTSGVTLQLNDVAKTIHMLTRVRDNKHPEVQSSQLDKYQSYDMEGVTTDIVVNNSSIMKKFGSNDNIFSGLGAYQNNPDFMRYTNMSCVGATATSFKIRFSLESSVPLSLFYGSTADIQGLFGLGSFGLSFNIDTNKAAKMFSMDSSLNADVKFGELTISANPKLGYSTTSPTPSYLSGIKVNNKLPPYKIPFDYLRLYNLGTQDLVASNSTVSFTNLVNIDRIPEVLFIRVAKDVDNPTLVNEFNTPVVAGSAYQYARVTNTNARITDLSININNRDIFLDESALYNLYISYGGTSSFDEWKYLSGSVCIIPLREIGANSSEVSYIGQEHRQNISIKASVRILANSDVARAGNSMLSAQKYSFEVLTSTPAQLEYSPEEGVKVSIGTNIAEGAISTQDLAVSLYQKPMGMYLGGGFFSSLGNLFTKGKRVLSKGVDWITQPENLKKAWDVVSKAASEGGRAAFPSNVMGGHRGGAQVSDKQITRNKLK
jgi:hypothetical protein